MCNCSNYQSIDGSCTQCGQPTGDNFNQLYANYYAKLSSMIGGKFTVGQGVAAVQVPPIDSNQYLNYLDVVTGSFYRYNIGTGNWDFLFNLSSAIEASINQWLIAGPNITLTPTVNGMEVSANVVQQAQVIPTLEQVTQQGGNTDQNVTISGHLSANNVGINTETVQNSTIANLTANGATIGVATISGALTVQGAATINNMSSNVVNAGGLHVGGGFWQVAPSQFGAGGGYALMAYDPINLNWAGVPRQQVLSGPSGSTPPTTGNFLPGDLYIAG